MAKKSGKSREPQGPATIQNRRARYDYEILDTLETGMVLQGSEVKSLYAGRAHIADAYCRIVNGELWVYHLDIEPWTHSSAFTPDRRRDRKLLAHAREIVLLERRAQERGLSIIPLSIYFKNGKAKMLVGTARGKHNYDKRESLKDKETKRDLRRELRDL
ncbi:MAG TPA: SsrA-binding protein SmpB [Fimbriimonadaceae bacterium]|jgi:SsrA-binding protein|nr:SsrA-binding protein [Armatimonadetes bacterium Uphvl-Ar2]MCE2938875.1 SsrA-binding protein SmpB [Fimbriimonadaceae bacterium]MCZ8138316.1 SsrA-binding protein SmpB [Fimbriimonadaceae bacterium]HRD31530.1 SsrA-binding protein SmpB [Fimbriimonadaceae bacterium]HRE94301.1 SsrA-binding protein SmpB [Fimbriimonadaceae bacterium]